MLLRGLGLLYSVLRTRRLSRLDNAEDILDEYSLSVALVKAKIRATQQGGKRRGRQYCRQIFDAPHP